MVSGIEPWVSAAGGRTETNSFCCTVNLPLPQVVDFGKSLLSGVLEADVVVQERRVAMKIDWMNMMQYLVLLAKLVRTQVVWAVGAVLIAGFRESAGRVVLVSC